MKMVFAAVAALSLGSAAVASDGPAARSPFGKPSAVVTLQGIDLATADGQQRLAIRVDQAARTICGQNLATIHLDLEARARACRADVAEQVRARIETRTAQTTAPAAIQVASLR
ncbi:MULTISPECIES: UrcA family protein [unclassified Sphingomonas]|jgi:UrcA family protein|uniref:UrcA family protein n=1 Tax=unclassified Sphingomonas TaxID=196159 RepID=UPI0025F0AF69|nr:MULTISPECIES: UrcA family protein [unclassified Sphingomonas]